MSDETAKAAREIAKTTSRAFGTAEKAGAYMARVLGTVPEDAVGLLGGDWLHHARVRNIVELQERTDQILSDREVAADNVEPVSERIARPLFEAAAAESRSELQEVWAKLLAAAMDPAGDRPMRRQFIDVVRQFEPLDVLLFTKVAERGEEWRDGWQHELQCTTDELELAIDTLKSTGCFKSAERRGNKEYRLQFSALGRALLRVLDK